MPLKIFVKSLPDECTSQDLRQLFQTYGEVGECAKLETKDIGFVHMTNDSEAFQAIDKLNGSFFMQNKIKVMKSDKSGTESVPGGGCHTCGQSGHFAKDCPTISAVNFPVRRGGFRGRGEFLRGRGGFHPPMGVRERGVGLPLRSGYSDSQAYDESRATDPREFMAAFMEFWHRVKHMLPPAKRERDRSPLGSSFFREIFDEMAASSATKRNYEDFRRDYALPPPRRSVMEEARSDGLPPPPPVAGQFDPYVRYDEHADYNRSTMFPGAYSA